MQTRENDSYVKWARKDTREEIIRQLRAFADYHAHYIQHQHVVKLQDLLDFLEDIE